MWKPCVFVVDGAQDTRVLYYCPMEGLEKEFKKTWDEDDG
jgi:hypothetical protein